MFQDVVPYLLGIRGSRPSYAQLKVRPAFPAGPSPLGEWGLPFPASIPVDAQLHPFRQQRRVSSEMSQFAFGVLATGTNAFA